jgi:hypothetical protein
LKTLDAVNPRGRSGYPQYLTLLGFEWFPCTDIVHFRACHEISVSNISGIRTNCIVPFSVE